MVVFYLLLFCAYVALHWYVAKEFHNAATAKGFPQKKYFWWCFWLSWMGWLMVIALPDRGGSQAVIVSDELPDL